jgi:uncharacterized protein (DUF2336 family)
MATITSFESLKRPSRSDLAQLAELLVPLFATSSPEACREAAAVLSQCPVLPQSVAHFLGTQPIEIAAIFLTRSKAVDDETLISIARTQGPAHARAIARRDNLSPTLVDMLVGLRQAEQGEAAVSDGSATAAPKLADKVLRTADTVREELRALVSKLDPVRSDDPKSDAAPVAQSRTTAARAEKPASKIRIPGLPSVSDLHDALLVRLGRQQDMATFAHTLADTIEASTALSRRIMQDMSGTQLATTLLALDFDRQDMAVILQSFYPHLQARDPAQNGSGQTLFDGLFDALDPAECGERLAAWLRADAYTFGRLPADPFEDLVPEADNQSEPTPEHLPEQALKAG